MAKKKDKDIKIRYKTEAEPKALCGTVPVFCAHDELVPIIKLVPNPKNPNTHPEAQIKLLAEIIKAQGWRSPITVSNRSGFIVKGHGRLAAAKLIGEELAPVDYQDYASEAEEYADLIADNRLSELAEIDTLSLTELLTELDTGEIPIELTGFTEDDIDSLVSAIAGTDDTEDDMIDAEVEPPQVTISQLGDLWYIGQHRVICGDSTDPATIERLMQGEKAQMVNTDPPYGVSYDDGNWDKIANDDLTHDDLMNKLLIPVFRQCLKHTKPDAAFYIWHACKTRRDFDDALTRVGLLEKQYLIWVKNSLVLGGADYQWQYEPCYYCEKAGESASWYGDRKQSTAWKVTMRGDDGLATVLTGGIVVTDGAGKKVYVSEKPPKGKKTRYVRLSDGRGVTLQPDESYSTVWEVSKESGTMHPTQKPVELALRAIENSSQVGDIVLDFFGGSHSTMIGAEMLGRQARICELEPKYVDVGIIRYVRLRGLGGTIRCVRGDKEYDLMELVEQTAKEHGITIEDLMQEKKRGGVADEN